MSTSSEQDVAAQVLAVEAMPTVFAGFRDGVIVVDDVESRFQELAERVECVAAASRERVFVGTFDAGVRRSDDAGRTWDAVGPSDISATAITVSPHDPDVVWAGTEPSALYRSTDGGERWTALPDLTTVPTASSWSFPPRPDTHHVRWVEVDPTDPDRVYVGIEAGALLVSEDGGETWQDRPPGSRIDNHSLATHPDAPGRVYAAAGDGYAESRDYGRTWTHPTDGMRHGYVWSVAVDPNDPDGVVVSAATGPRTAHTAETAESYVYRHTMDGWTVSMAGLPDASGTLRPLLAPVPGQGGFVLVSNRGVFGSSDGGRTWRAWPVTWPAVLRDANPRGVSVVG